jgi:hypothetical protein
MQGHTVDSLEEWRIWPVHAIAGVITGGEFLTSTAVTALQVQSTITGDQADVRVAGPITGAKENVKLNYERTFAVRPNGLIVRTTLKSATPVQFAELRETLPVFLHEQYRVKDTPVKIQFQVGDNWLDATPEPQANVKGVRIGRFQGAVTITFDRPRTVALAPRDWTDGFQTQATCRTLFIDLLDGRGPQAIDDIGVEYTLSTGQMP